jgi:drug/metabolite transporter (DMT)-like permease
MGLFVLFLIVLFRHQFDFFGFRECLYFALLGFIGITFHQWLQSTGLETSKANTTGWIVASMPIFIALLGWLILGEKMGRPEIIGISLAACGVLMVVTNGNFRTLFSGKLGAPGDIFILLSAPNWAVFSILSRKGLRSHSASLMMLYVMGFGWLFSSLLFISGKGWEPIHLVPIEGWLAIGFLGIFCSGLAYVFWYDALKVLPAAQVGTFLFAEPLVTVGASYLVLSEKMNLVGLLGGLIILLGVWLVNRSMLKNKND